jgi:hypothetical protein
MEGKDDKLNTYITTITMQRRQQDENIIDLGALIVQIGNGRRRNGTYNFTLGCNCNS